MVLVVVCLLSVEMVCVALEDVDGADGTRFRLGHDAIVYLGFGSFSAT